MRKLQSTTPKQERFVELWMTPTSASFGNAYESAIRAGFSESYARKITADSNDTEWLSEFRSKLTTFTPEHTLRSIQNIAETAPLMRDRLTALNMIAKIQGLYIDRVMQQIDVKFVNNVPRPKLT